MRTQPRREDKGEGEPSSQAAGDPQRQQVLEAKRLGISRNREQDHAAGRPAKPEQTPRRNVALTQRRVPGRNAHDRVTVSCRFRIARATLVHAAAASGAMGFFSVLSFPLVPKVSEALWERRCRRNSVSRSALPRVARVAKAGGASPGRPWKRSFGCRRRSQSASLTLGTRVDSARDRMAARRRPTGPWLQPEVCGRAGWGMLMTA